MSETNMQTIEIIIQPDGQTTVETKGFAGSECREASEFLEKALGQTTREELTAEFHQAADNEITEQQRE